VTSIFFLVWGITKKSWKLIALSCMFLLLPSLYSLGTNNGFKLLVLLPVIPFILAFRFKKEAL
jgi:hypothetical protein